jgi:phage gpG-like protein
MPEVQVFLKVRDEVAQAKLEETLKRAEDLRPVMPKVIGAMRESVRLEFEEQRWANRAGRFSDWLPHSSATRAMTDYEEHPLLNKSGTLRGAWLGLNTHGFSAFDQDTAVIGVRGLPYAAIHRGAAETDQVRRSGHRGGTKIAVTPKMRMFLGLAKGLWLKAKTKYIRIPARPHATPNPRLRRALRQIMKDWVIDGDLTSDYQLQ